MYMRFIATPSRIDQPQRAPRAVLYLPGQLAAGGIDVVAARLARGGDDAGLDQDRGEALDALRGRTRESGTRERIERYQIELARHVAHQFDQLPYMFVGIIDAVE